MPTYGDPVNNGPCGCCGGCCGGAFNPTGFLIESPCAGIDGVGGTFTHTGPGTWVATAETDCITCHTVTITMTCSGSTVSGVIAYSGTSVNPSPPPDNLTCVATGFGGGGCTEGTAWDCGTATGTITQCLAALFSAPGSIDPCCSGLTTATLVHVF